MSRPESGGTIALLFVLILGLMPCAGIATPILAQSPAAVGPAVTPAERVVMQQVEAYNRRDLEAFLATYAPDVRWYTFPDSLGGTGIERMRQIFSRMFTEETGFKAEILGKMVSGDFVVLREHVSGLRSGIPIEEVVIYEVKGEKITRVWFLP